MWCCRCERDWQGVWAAGPHVWLGAGFLPRELLMCFVQPGLSLPQWPAWQQNSSPWLSSHTGLGNETNKQGKVDGEWGTWWLGRKKLVNSVGFGSRVFTTNTVSLGKLLLSLGSVSSLRRRLRSPGHAWRVPSRDCLVSQVKETADSHGRRKQGINTTSSGTRVMVWVARWRRWQNACHASMKAWVQFPTPSLKKKPRSGDTFP